MVGLAGVLLVAPTEAAPTFQAGCSVNLLANPGFEGGFRQTSLSSFAADGWEPWYVDDGTGDSYFAEPEYKAADGRLFPNRVHSGFFAQQFFNSYRTHTAGFWQRVPVPPGSRVRFSMWVHVWSSSQNDPNVSTENGKYRLWVGIDPTGAISPRQNLHPDWESILANVVWAGPIEQYDAWGWIDVTAVAQADAVTVFTRGSPEWPVTNNNSYWDDGCLEVLAPPTPTPTRTLRPTPTLTSTPTLSPTATPTATPTPTATSIPSPLPRPSPTPSPPTLFAPERNVVVGGGIALLFAVALLFGYVVGHRIRSKG